MIGVAFLTLSTIIILIITKKQQCQNETLARIIKKQHIAFYDIIAFSYEVDGNVFFDEVKSLKPNIDQAFALKYNPKHPEIWLIDDEQFKKSKTVFYLLIGLTSVIIISVMLVLFGA